MTMKVSFRLIRLKNSLKFLLINIRYRLRYRLKRVKKRNTLYLIFVPDRKHAGLSDRLKVMVSVYHDAKLNGYRFKCYWETPFPLSQYLEPRYDWVASLNEWEYSIFDTKIINESNGERSRKLCPNKQYHVYNYYAYAFDEYFNDIKCSWLELFNELFKPSKKIEDVIGEYAVKPHSYISVHLRFVNALEHFENTFFNNSLKNEEERLNLIAKCKRGIQKIIDEHPDMPIYVFSDSKVFLDSLTNMPVSVLDHDKIGHCNEITDESVYLKTFVDLIFMSRSKEIYWITCPEIYQYSGFAKMAARIGGIKLIQKRL